MMRCLNVINKLKRNSNRFPKDFIFQLGKEEAGSLTFQIETSKSNRRLASPRDVARALLRPVAVPLSGVPAASVIPLSPRILCPSVFTKTESAAYAPASSSILFRLSNCRRAA
jgi:hypothetical protein